MADMFNIVILSDSKYPIPRLGDHYCLDSSTRFGCPKEKDTHEYMIRKLMLTDETGKVQYLYEQELYES